METSGKNCNFFHMTAVRLFLFVVFAIVIIVPLAVLLPSPNHPDQYLQVQIGSHWHGWSSIEQLISFGDSWSSTGFDPNGTRPSRTNNFGNPALPGYTATNGFNWLEYLANDFNESLILAFDLAAGGATVDTQLIRVQTPASSLKSLKQQVQEWEHIAWDWTADTALFTIWIGVNDITHYTNETRANFGLDFEVFRGLLDQLYARGGRNFLILNAPPLQRAPIASDQPLSKEWPEVIAQWNANVTAMIRNFITVYREATTLLYDINKLYNDVMDDPCCRSETCGMESTNDYCKLYSFDNATDDPYRKEAACPYSVDKYFWLNSLHPTTRTHNMTARAVYDAIKRV